MHKKSETSVTKHPYIIESISHQTAWLLRIAMDDVKAYCGVDQRAQQECHERIE